VINSSDSSLEFFFVKVEKIILKNSISVQFALSYTEHLKWEQSKGMRKALEIRAFSALGWGHLSC
jgi:hypothetical protein